MIETDLCREFGINTQNPKVDVVGAWNTAQRTTLTERSLQRLEQWILSKDIAGISAWRSVYQNRTEDGGEYDKTTQVQPKRFKREKPTTSPSGQSVRGKLTPTGDVADGETVPTETKKFYNRELKAKLLSMGYGVIDTKGVYREAGVNRDQGPEDSFCVVNLKDDPIFYENIFKLSEYYNQDSFLYKANGSDQAYLVGTNYAEFPGYGKQIPVGQFFKNVTSEFMSRIGNKGYAFAGKDDVQDEPNPANWNDRKNQRIETMECFDRCSLGAKQAIRIIAEGRE